MKNEDIQKRIQELDDLIPKEGTQIKIEQYGGGPDESQMIGNKAGYLRMGLELMKGAFHEDPERLDIDLDEIITENSEVHIDHFKRCDMPPTTDSSVTLSEKIYTALFFLLVLSLGSLTLIGFISVVRFLLP